MENILIHAFIMSNDLDEEQKTNFIDHYKNNEPIYILTNNKNIEYIITNYDGVKFELLFNNKIII